MPTTVDFKSYGGLVKITAEGDVINGNHTSTKNRSSAIVDFQENAAGLFISIDDMELQVEDVTDISVDGVAVTDLEDFYTKMGEVFPSVGGGTSSTPVSIIDLTDAATIEWDVNDGRIARVTLGGNRTLEMSNLQEGDSGILFVTQDSTGGRTLNLPGESAEGFSLTTDPGTVTMIGYFHDGVNTFFSREQYGVINQIPLTIPGNFTATAQDDSSILLEWDAQANEEEFELYQSANGTSGWTLVDTIAADEEEYLHSGLDPEEQVFYRIKAIGDGVTYSDSGYATANATTEEEEAPTGPTVTGGQVYYGTPGVLLLNTSEPTARTNAAGWSVTGLATPRTIVGADPSGSQIYIYLSGPMADGDLPVVHYNSAVGNFTNLAATQPMQSADQSCGEADLAPAVVLSATTLNASTVRLIFDRGLTFSSGITGMTFEKDGVAMTINSVSPSSGNTILDYNLADTMAAGNVITYIYDAGPGDLVTNGIYVDVASIAESPVTNTL